MAVSRRLQVPWLGDIESVQARVKVPEPEDEEDKEDL